MQRPEPPTPQDAETEFRAIEATLLETARGRWFLSEHGRRSRRMETSALESAIGQLKSSLRAPPAVMGRMRGDLTALLGEVEEARNAVLAREAVPPRTAEGAGDRHAPHGILRAAEDLHELAWSLQARDVDSETCARIGRQAATIFALAAQQAQESQRARLYAETLDRIMDSLRQTLSAVEQEGSIQPDEVPAAVA